MDRQSGSTSNTIYVLIRSKAATPAGMGLTGLAFGTAGLVFGYVRDGAARVAIALVTQTVTGAYTSGGFVEIDAINAPGLYRLDVPDAVFAAGVKSARIFWTGANSIDDGVEIDLPNYDPLAAGATAPANFSSLAISAAGIVSADTKKVNGVTVNGDGVTVEWGP